MATINLGAIKFNWKGAYNNGTTYAVDDVVSSGGNSYVCIQASTGNAVGNATAYWNLMSQAGTNGTDGTDVGTTLTTQSDLLYRDGSGLQRLPKGSANQLLRINSGATAPEWHTPATVSSDVVKLYHQEITSSAVSSIYIQNFFNDSVYAYYELQIHSLSTSNDSSSSQIQARMMTSTDTPDTGSNYFAAATIWGATASGDTDGSGRDIDASSWNFSRNNIEGGDTNTSAAQIKIFNPTSTTFKTYMQSSCYSLHANADNLYQNYQYGHYNTTAAHIGITFYPTSGTLDKGNFTLYGYKK